MTNKDDTEIPTPDMPPEPPKLPVEPPPEPPMDTNSEKIYKTAKRLLGQHLSGDNSVLGCATTVNEIVRRATGQPIGGGASTALMYSYLITDKRFTRTVDPIAGDIVISPTGTSTLGTGQHGHVGIVANYGILSNSSETGLLTENYTKETWQQVFHVAFKFPVYYFHVI